MPLDDRLEQQISARLGDQLYLDAQRNALNDVSPATARRDSQLRRRSGIPLQSFDETTRPIAEIRERQNRAREAVQRAPTLAPVLADPRRYSRVADDLDSLARLTATVSQMALLGGAPGGRNAPQPDLPQTYLESVFETAGRLPIGSFIGSLVSGVLRSGSQDIRQRGAAETARAVGRDLTPRRIGRSLAAGGARLVKQVHGVNEMLAPIVSPFSPLVPIQQQSSRESGDYWRQIAESYRSPSETRFGRDVLSGVESAPASVVAYGGGAVTGSARMAAAALGLLTAGGSYREGRAANLSPLHATFYGIVDGTIEAGTELIPLRGFLDDVAAGRGAARTILRNVLLEAGTEEVATLGQDFNRWANIDGPNGKPFTEFVREIPDRAVSTFISSAVVASAQTSAGLAVNRLANRSGDGGVARAAGRLADRIMEAAGSSKLRQESPEDFRELLMEQMEGKPGEVLYIPAEIVRTLHQSPEDLAEDSFWGDYVDQITEAEALGGDVVIPLADAATHLAGSPQWEAIRDHVRVTPGGMSRAEADEAEAAFADAMRETGEQLAAAQEAERAAAEPAAKVYEAMRDKLMLAGFRPDAASNLASLFAQRQRVRAERLGRELTGSEANTVEVRQVLPEALATQLRKADDLDIVIAAMRGRQRTERRVSLLDYIAARGGIEDRGGDIAAMGAGPVRGRAGHGQRRIIREHAPEGQGAMFAAGINANTPDALALAAWEAGYFPQFSERPAVNDLLEAIERELRGDPVFAEERPATEELRSAAQDLQQLLDQEGLDAASATPQQIRETVERFQSAAAEEGARSLEQSFMEGPRGRIDFRTDGGVIINLFESRDLSTFIHESGHLFLEELRADAELALGMDTPEARQLFADWEAVKAWFKREGHEIGEDGQIPTEAHELWARGFERFAMEGKAPTSALRRAFEAFRSWLLTIYKVVDNLRAPITPEIREVMTRLIATDEEIAAAADEQEIRALFRTAEEAGMTEAEFGAYRRATEEARDEAYDALLYRTMATIRAARTKEFKEREASARAEVAEEVDRQPVFRALRLLRTGQLADEEPRRIRLDKQWLIETYGEDALDALPRQVPPIHADRDTTQADLIAEEVGFASGDEMVRTLMGYETARAELRARGDKRSPRQVQIDEGTAARMAERYGDPLRDGSIEEEARALIHSDRQGEVIASELRALARRSNRRPTPYSIARQWAADKVAAGRVVDMTSGAALQQYERAARRAGKAAEEAMLKGDVDETYRQKQAQMLNNALIAEGKKAKDRVDVAVRRLGRIARRRTMASVDHGYLDQAHQLLEQVDFATRSQRDLDKQKSFEAWHAEQTAAGHDVVAPESFAFALGATHWSRLRVEELIGLDDTVQQIMHLGRLKQTLLDGQERRAFEEIVAEAVAAAGRLPPKAPSDLMEPSFGERLKHNVAAFDAALLKVETLVDWLDSKDPGGVFNRIVFKPIAEAQGRAADMFGDYVKRLNEALEKVPSKRLRTWADHVSAPELLNRETGNPFVFTRQQLISMALNMGNEGNAQRLADGYGWSEQRILAVLNRELTVEEWRYVQDVWDILNGLWPEIEALETRVNGLPPEKVPARPLETSAGTLPGGYFPAVYDSRRDYQAEANAARETDLFEARYTRATSRASATKERAEEVKRPILLNLGVITRHVGEVIHDVTHREAVMNADKFLSSRRVMRAIDESLGPEMRAQFRPWLKFVANQWAMERAGNEGVGRFMNALRSNATVVGMGFRFTTMAMQLGGYSNSFEVIGARWVTPAVAQAMRHPVETFRFVMDRSAEMRHRMDTIDRDIDAGIRRLSGRIGALTAARRFAFHGIGYMDRMVVIPSWLGAYNKALARGLDDQEAVYAADKAIRQSQGAGAAKDIAAVARGQGQWGQALKLMTMFYSYLSAVYQRQRTLGRDVRAVSSVRELPALMARAWWLIVVPPLFSEILAGRGPDNDEDWGWWAFKNMLSQGLGAIPVVRDLIKPIFGAFEGKNFFDYQLSPMQRTGQAPVEVVRELSRTAQGEETNNLTRDSLEAVGYWTGLVPGQFAQAAQFLVDVSSGEADPETANDWFKGLTTGRMPEE